MSEHTFSVGRDRNRDWQEVKFSDKLWDCHRYDITMQQLLSFNNGSNFGATLSGDACTIKWMYRDEYPDHSYTCGPLEAAESEGEDCYDNQIYPIVELAVKNPEYFHRYQVIKACVPDDMPLCDSEVCQPGDTTEEIPLRECLLYVEDRDCKRGVLYVRQGFGGSRVCTIPEETKICVLYSAAPECPEPVDTYRAGYTSDENYLQRFYSGYSMTEKSTKLYYEGNISAMQEMEDHRRSLFGGQGMGGTPMTGKLPRELEQALFNGIGYPGDTTGTSRMRGIWSFGLPHYCLKTLNYQDIRQIFLDLDNSGASINEGNYMMIGSNEVQMIMDDWVSYRVANDTSDNNRYGYGLNAIDTSFGSASFTRHRGRALKSNQILLIDMNKIALYIDSDWQEKEVIGGTNLCAEFEIWGLFTMLLACPCHHALITIDSKCFSDQCCGTDNCMPQSEAPEFCEPFEAVKAPEDC